MVIQHNMPAQNAERIFENVTRLKAKESEKLVSGYRINRAADDAAGLSISEKLRTQIRGLGKAEDNIQNGISLLQTADGALGEIENVMQRMRELCVQGANDVYVDEDREAIQEELKNLSQGIDNILEYTEFNTKKILKLGEAYTKYVETVAAQLPSSVTLSGDLQLGAFQPFASANYAFATMDFSGIRTAADVAALLETGFHTTCCTCDNKYNIRFVNNASKPTQNVGRNPVYDVNIDGLTNGAQVVEAIVKSVVTNHYTEFMADPQNAYKLYIYDNRVNQSSYPSQNYGVVRPELIHTDAIIDDPSGLQIQVGPNTNQLLKLGLPTLSAAILGVDTLSVKSNMGANISLLRMDVAIERMNLERANIGALQNRLEKAYAYAQNAEENQQAAETKIRDTDMAESMVKFAGLNILADVGQSMISQANQNSSAVLALLR